MTLRAGALALALALPMAFAPQARAEDADDAIAAKIVVVDVDPAATEIDAAGLREAIGKELGATAVAPDDARAARARTIAVSIDAARHALVVSYREHTATVTRSIDLPLDPDATARAAVLLAGNLARDEAGELVATLRKEKPPADAASATGPAPVEPIDEEPGKLDRLGATLEFHAHNGHSLRLAIEWTMLLAGIAAEGVGLGLSLDGHSDAGQVLLQGGLGLTLSSVFVAPGHFEELTLYYAHARATDLSPELAREDVEQAWLRVARKEHWNRKFLGWLETVLGGAGAALLTTYFAATLESPTVASRTFLPTFTGLLVVDAIGLTLGITCLTTDGPVESALHDYEASAGHAIVPSGASEIGPRFSLTQGGGLVGIGGRF
jgi:hypothetical protein